MSSNIVTLNSSRRSQSRMIVSLSRVDGLPDLTDKQVIGTLAHYGYECSRSQAQRDAAGAFLALSITYRGAAGFEGHTRAFLAKALGQSSLPVRRVRKAA
jgi:hypothetical protein